MKKRLLNSMLFAMVSLAVAASPAIAQKADSAQWNKAKAAEWMDQRAAQWLSWSHAQHPVEGENRTVACIACHTIPNYTATRPFMGMAGGSVNRVLDDLRRRIIAGEGVPAYHVQPAGRLTESRGSEAINSAYVMALTDFGKGLKEPSALTISAFERLWLHQRADGGWDTFNFTYEPYATIEARHMQACIVAIALARAPGYLSYTESDPSIKPRIELLRKWLLQSRNPENLWGETWLLQASLWLDGLLTPTQQQEVVQKLLAQQSKDGVDRGSWTLYRLNQWKYSQQESPKTPRKLADSAKNPDGLSTGLITYTLIRAGMKPSDPAIADALAWLRRNQQADGSWQQLSISKDRKPSDPAYLFLSDEATVWSVRALLAGEGWPY